MRSMTGRMIATIAVCLVAGTAGGLPARNPGLPAPNAASSAPKAAPPTTDLTQLAWMAGSWSGQDGGATMEEHWTRPAGGLMVGMHRDVFGNGKSFFEFLRIEQREDGVFYMAMPAGRPATPFKMMEIAARKVVFENREHDYPQRITYWGEEDGRLRARVEGLQGDKPRAEQWAWDRASLAAP